MNYLKLLTLVKVIEIEAAVAFKVSSTNLIGFSKLAKHFKPCKVIHDIVGKINVRTYNVT